MKLTKEISLDITHIIVQTLDDLKIHNLEDGIFQIRQDIAAAIAQSWSEVSSNSIAIEARWNSGSDHPLDEGAYRFYLRTEVLKSEEEIQAEKAWQQRAEDRERELLKQLKEKYEGTKADGNGTAL